MGAHDFPWMKRCTLLEGEFTKRRSAKSRQRFVHLLKMAVFRKRAQRAKRALYYIYNIVTVLPRSASGPARSRIDWISRSRRALSVQSAQRAAVAEGLRRREAPAKARSGGLFDPLRYSGTGKLSQVADFPSLKMMHFCFIVPNKCCVSFKCLKKTRTPCRK